MDEYVPELQESVDTSAELEDKTIAVREGGLMSGRHLSEDSYRAHCDIQNPADPLIYTQTEREPRATLNIRMEQQRRLKSLKSTFKVHVMSLTCSKQTDNNNLICAHFILYVFSNMTFFEFSSIYRRIMTTKKQKLHKMHIQYGLYYS